MAKKRKNKKQSQTSQTSNNESHNESNNTEQIFSTNQQTHNKDTETVSNSNISKEIQLPPLEELSNTGFKILPIEISSQNLIFDSNSSDSFTFTSIHYCYFKSHESRNNDSFLPPDNTLFISNLPVDSTEAHIKNLFQECGPIDKIIFNEVIKDDEFLISIVNESGDNVDENNNSNGGLNENVSIQQGRKSKKKKKKKPKVQGGIEKRVIGNYKEGGLRKLLIPDSSAHIVFQTSEGLKKALEMTQKKRTWAIKDTEIPSLGLSRWLQDYRLHRPDQSKLQEEVDEYMCKFEEAELERHKALEAKLNQPDEDGFIMVTRVGRRSTNTDGTITVTAAKPEEIKSLKPKNKEFTDFYRFQKREAKRNKIIDLRKKFEEDKEKIAKLKAARRFKPY
ncbi:ribosomal RNA-processing protein 7-domain-containing protein [Glomus cerebriforme]|uniref:Ribosomal RNA-processing protein 7-domain-containing protein n=1 Tax=Glomus cerebriforme TaxID=658196 RepID=A0A397SWL5_9GLOM|nr:ribosomal RNA-processing protein 7-domain-containing protein [Glomus cerebriforme]